jgi:hypothetical protein
MPWLASCIRQITLCLVAWVTASLQVLLQALQQLRIRASQPLLQQLRQKLILVFCRDSHLST